MWCTRNGPYLAVALCARKDDPRPRPSVVVRPSYDRYNAFVAAPDDDSVLRSVTRRLNEFETFRQPVRVPVAPRRWIGAHVLKHICKCTVVVWSGHKLQRNKRCKIILPNCDLSIVLTAVETPQHLNEKNGGSFVPQIGQCTCCKSWDRGSTYVQNA